ncbi:LuxR family transcriptional regulator [Bdellovibrio sp. qaytius]|nr:LuxR family transcriptional regulator [Bdellovibrio sp. qaytius]
MVQTGVLLRPREILLLQLTCAVVLVFSIFDIVHDVKIDSSFFHLGIDAFLALLILIALVILIYRAKVNGRNIAKLQTAYSDAKKQIEITSAEKVLILKGIGEYIDRQFNIWKLSSAEKEIAMLLLKGLSHIEISEIRQTSERTVRQQSLNIYAKAQLKGRSDLAAFFLEDFLSPDATIKPS